MEQEEHKEQLTDKISYKVFAIFFMVFSILVLIAIFFTETATAKITNLVCGLILLAIGSLFLFQSRKKDD